jgi:quinone-modifying oxidoreductase subunit QmoA
MGSLKQTHYVQEAFGDAGKSTIYYIDIRAIDRFEDFYQKVKANPNVSFVKSKVARITEDKDGNPVCNGVNVEGYKRYAQGTRSGRAGAGHGAFRQGRADSG